MSIAEQLHAVVDEIENDQIGDQELAALLSARSRLNKALRDVEIGLLIAHKRDIGGRDHGSLRPR